MKAEQTALQLLSDYSDDFSSSSKIFCRIDEIMFNLSTCYSGSEFNSFDSDLTFLNALKYAVKPDEYSHYSSADIFLRLFDKGIVETRKHFLKTIIKLASDLIILYEGVQNGFSQEVCSDFTFLFSFHSALKKDLKTL